MTLRVVHEGFVPDPVDYHAGWARQREVHAAVVAGTAPDTLLLLEHGHFRLLLLRQGDLERRPGLGFGRGSNRRSPRRPRLCHVLRRLNRRSEDRSDERQQHGWPVIQNGDWQTERKHSDVMHRPDANTHGGSAAR